MKLTNANTIKLAKPILFISVASFSMVAFTYLTPPILDESLGQSIIKIFNLPGDFSIYIFRFLLCFVLLGVLPFIIAIAFKEHPKNMGFIFPVWFFKSKLFFILLIICIFIGIASAFFPDLSSYYPYSLTLIEYIKNQGIHFLFLHYLLYFFLYYLPWEFFFRGFLIFPFLKYHVSKNKQNTLLDKSPSELIPLLAIILFQTIPSTLLHFGHPFSEVISAIPAGIIFGLIAYKTRSIIPSLIFHSLIGISLDTFIILRGLRIIP